MQTIRRLYLYAVSFVSLEVILWGLIGLLRSFIGEEQGMSDASRLALALSLMIVGLPVFLLHGWLAQRNAIQEIAERSARVRAIFLYAALLATLAPILSNLAAWLNRSLLSLAGLDPRQALIGGDQQTVDNLIALAINGLAAGFIFLVIRADWQKNLTGESFPEIRRLYRHLWLVIGIALTVFGVQQIVRSLLERWMAAGEADQASLLNGFTLLLVGLPVWIFTSRLIQRSLSDPAEAGSLTRLATRYALAFAGLSSLLLSTGLILRSGLYELLSGGLDLGVFLGEIRQPLSVALTMGGVWAIYRPASQAREPASLEPANRRPLHRLYGYAFALFGLGATFIGLQVGLSLAIDIVANRLAAGDAGLTMPLATALANMVVGAPVWLLFWRPVQQEASDPGEAGDSARRSLVRKIYLFFILFAVVIGIMVSTGELLYELLSAALGEPSDELLNTSLHSLKSISLFALFLVYHWRALRLDARLVGRSLAKRQALYPVLVLSPDESPFAERTVRALEHLLPGLPVAVHRASAGAPDESLSAAKAVILPTDLIVRPPEALRLWLNAFPGVRVVVPAPVKDWYWVSGLRYQPQDWAQQTAHLIRSLSEGEAIPAVQEASPLLLVVYLLAGLFALELLILAAGLLISLVTG